jgi:predicted nucleic acid-binding protein
VIVVSDTSPLNYLILIDAVDVLPELFKDIHVPPGVMEELQHPRTPLPVKAWVQSPPEWLRITTPTLTFPETALLDRGETQAIALARELHATAILIDEKKGRRVARGFGFATFGTITVLELAAQHRLLDLKSAFESLQRTTFQITQPLIDAALERDAARRISENA